MISVVTFLWTKPGYRSQYKPEHVATLARMVRRHYPHAHRFICFNDKGIEGESNSGVNWRPLWTDHANVTHPHGAHNPSCYRRLKLYSDWAREEVGPRIVSLDLDMVITGDLSPLWNRPDAFCFWSDQLNPHGRVNGAMQLITPGARDNVWSSFSPELAQHVGRERGKWGSDQGWLAHCFPEGSHGSWGAADGAVSWRVHCKPQNGALPAGARIVNWHGHESPWDTPNPPAWVKEHYC